MSETCPLRRLQEAVEHLSGHDDIEESVYLDACNAMMELHPLTKLFKVTYLKFYVEPAMHQKWRGARARSLWSAKRTKMFMRSCLGIMRSSVVLCHMTCLAFSSPSLSKWTAHR